MARTNRRKTVNRTLRTLYFGFLFIALTIGCAAGWIHQSPVLFTLFGNRMGSMIGLKPHNPFEGQDSVTLLILGCDEEWYFGGKQLIRHQARSDMMLVTKLDFKNKRITGLSIPRDTLVAVPGHDEQKINAYHALGGNDLAKAAVETLLPSVHVDRVMALDYNAFKQMVDLAGGVDVYVPKKMDYDDRRGHIHIHLKPGKQHLNGDDAEGFVRFRHSDSDFKRTSRQRDFLLAFKEAAFHHFTQLPSIVNKAVDVTDHALSNEELAYIADFSQKVGSDNIEMDMLPVLEIADSTNLRMDEAHADEVLRKLHFIEDFTSTTTAGDQRVSLRQ